ncbi:MAG: hypothetical protein ABIS67_02005, partial [Candidatus Eisenbacteria bacterium]
MSRPPRIPSGLRRALATFVMLLLPAVLLAALGSNAQTGPKSAGLPELLSGLDTVEVLGWDTYVKAGPGSGTVVYELEFEADTIPGKRYLVQLLNGSTPATGALVYADSQQWVGSSQFGSSTSSLSRIIEIGTSGTHGLSLWISGPSGASVDLRVIRVGEPTYTVYGPQTFVRPATISTQTVTFARADTAKPPFTMRVINGSPGGSNRVTTGTVSLHGIQALGSSDFGTGIATIHRDVTLLAPDTLVYLQPECCGNVAQAAHHCDRLDSA